MSASILLGLWGLFMVLQCALNFCVAMWMRATMRRQRAHAAAITNLFELARSQAAINQAQNDVMTSLRRAFGGDEQTSEVPDGGN
jgi:hypothetical protein